MPAPQLHLTFGMMVKDQPGIHPALRRACSSEPVYTRLGAIFHDLPYYGNMLAEAVRYGLRSPALDEPWAYRMHSVRPERFGASGHAPAGETWAGWVRRFRHFGLLVSMPIAKRNSDKKGRDPLLRPRYFENDVFRFWDFYGCSERRVTELCNLGHAYFDAGDF